MKLVDMNVEEFEQLLDARLTTAITRSEMRVIEMLSDRMDEGFQIFEDRTGRRFQGLRDEMDERFQGLHDEMDGSFKNLQSDMDERFNEVGYAIDNVGSLIDQDHAKLGKRLGRLEKRSH